MESKEMQKVENKDVVVARIENYDVGQEHYKEPVKTWDKGQDDFEKIITAIKGIRNRRSEMNREFESHIFRQSLIAFKFVTLFFKRFEIR